MGSLLVVERQLAGFFALCVRSEGESERREHFPYRVSLENV